jgi:hypothetical protein
MAISSLDKNSIGICLSLLLVIILSESRLFKFFTDTYLGRAFLIIIILFASYLHKILGVVCVLIIIIMFNNNINDFSSYYEGFGGNASDASNNKTDKKNTSVTITDSVSATTTTGDNKNKPITTPTPVPNDKINVVTSSTTSSKDSKNVDESADNTTSNNIPSKAIEGFDLQSTENNIKRGRQSNSIPVNQYNKQSIEVAPYETSSFSNFFGLL